MSGAAWQFGRERALGSRSLTDLRSYEVLSQGVFAIAITLLVLDIHVPSHDEATDGQTLVAALVDEWPRYFAYVLGFLYIGEYWLASIRTMHFLRGADHPLLVLGLLTLMGISSVPFVTSLLAEYIGAGDGRDQVATAVFNGWMLVVALLANLLVRWAAFRDRLIRPDADRRALGRWLRLALLGPVFWAVALVMALTVSAAVALAFDFLVLLLFLLDVPLGNAGEEDAAARA
jgi:uncharacterized membrane protein